MKPTLGPTAVGRSAFHEDAEGRTLGGATGYTNWGWLISTVSRVRNSRRISARSFAELGAQDLAAAWSRPRTVGAVKDRKRALHMEQSQTPPFFVTALERAGL